MPDFRLSPVLAVLPMYPPFFLVEPKASYPYRPVIRALSDREVASGTQIITEEGGVVYWDEYVRYVYDMKDVVRDYAQLLNKFYLQLSKVHDAVAKGYGVIPWDTLT